MRISPRRMVHPATRFNITVAFILLQHRAPMDVLEKGPSRSILCYRIGTTSVVRLLVRCSLTESATLTVTHIPWAVTKPNGELRLALERTPSSEVVRLK